MVDVVKERVKIIINTEKRNLEFEQEIEEFFNKRNYRKVGTDWSDPPNTILYFSID